jgi:hypothetical protein
MLAQRPILSIESKIIDRILTSNRYSFTQLGEDIGLKGGVGAVPPARGSTPVPRPNPNP